MAGGQGTRFWPMSTAAKPKQFLALTSSRSMIQETYSRFLHRIPQEDIYIVTTREYVPLLRDQLPELAEDHIIEEPERRDTGPCMAWTAHFFLRNGVDDILITAPSDQYIPDGEAFHRALEEAERLARQELAIVTLGIKPTRPETGFGYIETVREQGAAGGLRVTRFLEKPTLEVARQLIQRDHLYWNSGIFIWRPSTLAHYMKLHAPDIWEPIAAGAADMDAVYSSLPRISVDYAVLEKAELIYTIPVGFQWDDVGTWSAMERTRSKDSLGNVADGDVRLHSARNSIVVSDGRKLIVAGVADLIIVSTDEGLLVCHKSMEHRLKEILKTSSEQPSP